MTMDGAHATTSSSVDDYDPSAPSDVPPVLPDSVDSKRARYDQQDNIPWFDQRGQIYLGPGAEKEAPLRGIGLPKLSRDAKNMLERALNHIKDESVAHLVKAQKRQQQELQMVTLRENIEKQQALTMMCTLYVGSISFELDEDSVKFAFSPFGPVKNVNMSRDPVSGSHKGYAFLEFEVPEGAVLAEDQMNGVLLGGRNLKVGRPANMPQGQHIISKLLEDAKNYNRIYIASVHQDLSEEDLRSVFEAFGTIKDVTLARPVYVTPKVKHRGFGYLEYEDPSSVVESVNAMNLFDLGGQYLRVCKAVIPPHVFSEPPPVDTGQFGFSKLGRDKKLPSSVAKAAAEVAAKLQALDADSTGKRTGNSLAAPPTVHISGRAPSSSGSNSPNQRPSAHITIPPPGVAVPSRRPPGAAPPASNGLTLTPSQHFATHLPPPPMLVPQQTVLVMRNMVTPTQLDDTLLPEVCEECKRYGRVTGSQVSLHRAENAVSVCIQFATQQEAEKARLGMHNRLFDGNYIVATIAASFPRDS